MGEPVRKHGAVAPTKRVLNDAVGAGFFFPGEVARLLQLEDIDYSQLRRLYEFTRRQAGEPVRTGWARYTLTDLACIEAALVVCGGRGVLLRGHRMHLGELERACDALRGLGFSNPLLQVPMRRRGKQVLAVVDGAVLDPATGQLLLDESFTAANAWLARSGVDDPELQTVLNDERTRAVAAGELRTPFLSLPIK
ncbi:MAG: hypothetical protein QOE92_2161 [Chloroflexota bacterium]|jgi:hypothetical protein|nr:hypothetical protein [Chloroflexota bacterium]